MDRHINFAKLFNRYPFLKVNDNTQGKLYIGLNTDIIGISLDYNNICYAIERIFNYLIFSCFDGRCYNITNKGHLIVIESYF